MTLRRLCRKVLMPVGCPSRKSILGEEDLEEVLEGSHFLIGLRQNGQAEVGSGLIVDGDHRRSSSCVPAI